ncbi:hypothetical protein SETIT_4G198400v2 [Setaria italica]|uniref:Uncharacterized protein n=1 Tax=Setaria italica TaxID=4555 RepID=A0A368QW42_SETIT|nr:hypothetical protein SETIT_4G198400v2 [Setaria italica]
MYVKIVYAVYVDLQAPCLNELDVEVLMTVKFVQILKINHNLVIPSAKENLFGIRAAIARMPCFIASMIHPCSLLSSHGPSSRSHRYKNGTAGGWGAGDGGLSGGGDGGLDDVGSSPWGNEVHSSSVRPSRIGDSGIGCSPSLVAPCTCD